MPADAANPVKLSRAVWEVLMYFALSGKICDRVTRLLPLKTWKPPPSRTFGFPDHASANRTSLIAPSTFVSSVSLTLSVPRSCLRTRLVSEERSRNVDELRPSAQACPIGKMPDTNGKRAVVVFAVADPAVTRRNSGEY
jgi:hypothetical protein